MSRSKRLYSEAKKFIPSGVNSPVRYYSPHPFFVTAAKGSLIRDADGRSYVDCCMGYGALLLGHARREILSAARAQLTKGTLYCAPTEQETTLSKMISKLYPSMQKTRLVNTGGEATMTAIRLARGFTKKTKIVKFEGCYHGAHDSVLVKAGSGAAGIPVSEGIPGSTSKNTLVARYNDSAQLEQILRRDGDIAGVIVEPVLANMGLILPQKGFLRDIRKITRQSGVPLIFDETVTGFRMSDGGAQKYYGVKPDITTLGKALGGGFAIAAVGGSARIMDRLAPAGRVYQASTFAGNPVSVSAAIASINTITKFKSRMYDRLARRCARLASAVSDMASDMKIRHQINSAGSMMQIFFTDRPVTDYATAVRSDRRRFEKLAAALRKSRVFVAPSQFEVVFLSNAHTTADIELVAEGYRRALGAARN